MKSITTLLLFLALGGCAVVRPTDPYLSGRASAGGSYERTPPALPAELPEGTMTLPQAIRIALANNPEVAALGWDAAAAAARRDRAFSDRLPKLGAAGGYAHHLDPQRPLPVGRPGDPTILSRDIVSADIVLSMPLFTGGRLISRVRVAELVEIAAGHRLARTREEISFNVSSLFFGILAQRRVIESLEFSRRALEEHIRSVDALVTARKAANVDRMRADVRLADVEQQLVREKNVLAIQRRALVNLLGLEGDMDDIELRGELESQTSAAVPRLDSAIASALEGRGDYLAARSALEAQARSVDAARAERWPTVLLQGAYGPRWAAGSTTGTGDELGDVGRIGLAVEVPLFEGGRIGAEVREQRANLAATQERLRRLELQVRLEIETALLNVRSSEERMNAIGKSIAQARESLRIEQQKYDLGKGAIVDVLDAQAALLESETTYYRVLAEHGTAIAQLKLATGEE
jgi:outer membrane protein